MKKVYMLLFLLALTYAGIFFTSFRPLLPGYHAFHYTPGRYQTLKVKIREERKEVRKLNREKQQAYFIRLFNERLFPYWYGTRWNFYGVTEQPGEGRIACGYFVTTVLRDAGVKLDRVKLACCASEQMIRSLVGKKHITYFNHMPLAGFIGKMKEEGEGLYIIGLDNHTGFILYQKNELRFIHSSGRFPFAVVNEDATASIILARSAYRVTGKLNNKEFMASWIRD